MNLLVIDVGSSSARALIFDAALRPLAQAARPYAFNTTPPGAAEVDANVLQALVEASVDEVLAAAPAQPIGGVGMAAFANSLLGVDDAGHPLTPVYSYADTRSAAHALALNAQPDAPNIYQRTGCLLHSAYHPARLRWLADMGVQAARWVDFSTYLYRQWFGRDVPCSYSLASWTGLLNRETLTWDSGLLAQSGVPANALPLLADYNTIQQGLAPDYAARWARLRDVPFCLAVGDGAAANVGCGAGTPGTLALTVGTTAALRVISTERLPVVPAGLWSYRVDAERHLLGGATNEGGSVFEWARRTLALPGDVETALAERAADSHGLTMLPLLAGERSPGWRADAVGTLHGLRLGTTPLDILHAALESVALRLAQIANALPTANVVYAGGGALAASPAWAQMCADALNRPLRLPAVPEITARGVGLLALRALRPGSAPDDAPPIARTVQPRADGAAALRAARERQQALYHRLYG